MRWWWKPGTALSAIHRLNDDTVLEFLTPMLADINGDGLNEAWVVHADTWDGARLDGSLGD